MREFESARLPRSPDATAPDGTAVRLLLALERGSLAHFELPAGAVSHAVTHRSVEEIWYFVGGRGEIWRAAGGRESVVEVAAGLAVTIPLGTAFQFRATDERALTFLAITMPPWPGAQEAIRVEGPWTPTVDDG
ncbi:MAG: cupin domain-containing protein [Roseiarcus sp.]|jgi:mannose-6-phosphate isomerase-like protein (cupin superfamily)